MNDFTFRSDPDADLASTDNYVTIPITAVEPGLITQFRAITTGPLSVNWKNTGANSIDSRVLGTNNPTAVDDDCDVVAAEAGIAAGAMRHVTIDIAHYAYYRFQHKATGAGSQGASNLHGRHGRF